MTTFDVSPLCRSTAGFDSAFDMLSNDAFGRSNEQSYPPYNIERIGDDTYEVSLAVAGFAPEDIAVTAERNVLTVEGRDIDKTERKYLYQGIATRAFRRHFNLADYVEVKGATFENGLLRIHLVRELPEAMKPRRIEVKNGAPMHRQVERRKAA